RRQGCCRLRYRSFDHIQAWWFSRWRGGRGRRDVRLRKLRLLSDLGHFGLDARPYLGLRLDRFDHEMQFAEPTLPQFHVGGECLVAVQQGPRPRALLEVEGAEYVFGGKRIRVVEFAHDLRHCSISSRPRRSDALSRSTGMSSLAASCSRLKAP